MLQFEVKGIALEKKSRLPLVLLHNPDKNILLPVHVGPFEASSIIVEMEGVQPPRPLTHDLLADIFLRHHFKLTSFEIYRCLEDKQLSRIRYHSRFGSHIMEVRPSDGIALAIRLNAPILVADEVVRTLSDNQELFCDSDFSRSEILYLESQKHQITLM
ncbi:MAG: bifunctional nuclease family protein [Spirochaetales bacterium]|nr:bifunctional nuclease family protein [Spirochaetales bacterium]